MQQAGDTTQKGASQFFKRMSLSMSPRWVTAAQIGGGLVVVVLIYVFSLWLLSKDTLVASPNDLRPLKQSVLILDGYSDTAAASDIDYSTVNPSAFNFVALRRSFNRKGGAQFSYSFWINLKDTTPANVAGKTLLLRGDKRVYDWNTEVTDPGTNTTGVSKTFSDVLVKCPRIRFGDTFDTIVIEFNTLADPGATIVISPDPETAPTADPSLRHNALKLIQNRWALLTFTFEDSVAISDFEDGIMVRFFLNDMLYSTSTMPSAFKLNGGNMFLLPTISYTDPASNETVNESPISNAQIGNVAYYNYALGSEGIRELFRAGPPRKPAAMMNGARGEPLYLSEFNKLDVYNT